MRIAPVFRALPYLFLPVFVTGCASCTQDPSQAGFFCGVQNITSGTYDRRQQALQWQATQRQEQSVAAEKRALAEQLSLLQADLSLQQRQLARARTQRGSAQETIAKLETQRNELQNRLNNARSGAVSPQEIASLKRDIDNLQNAISKVLKAMISGTFFLSNLTGQW
jgi:chromosome segregation ATPase